MTQPTRNPTRAELLQWQRQGRHAEVRAALRAMRWRALWRGWIAFGVWLGHIVSPLMLGLIYLTLFLPFGLIGRLTGRSAGRWIQPSRLFPTTAAALRNPG